MAKYFSRVLWAFKNDQLINSTGMFAGGGSYERAGFGFVFNVEMRKENQSQVFINGNNRRQRKTVPFKGGMGVKKKPSTVTLKAFPLCNRWLSRE